VLPRKEKGPSRFRLSPCPIWWSYQALVDASISELEAIATEWRKMLTPIDPKELAVALDATLAL
jgi:hypothetical protein